MAGITAIQDDSVIIFNAAATVGTPQYSDIIYVPDDAEIGVTITHPASTTTLYTCEVSNQTKNEIAQGAAFEATPYELLDKNNVELAAVSTAQNFPIVIAPPFRIVRFKAVTTVGSSVIKMRAWFKRMKR